MKVFYRPEMNSEQANSFSPSAGKPKLAVNDWLRRGIITPEDILSFHPATVDELASAHDRNFVEGVLALDIDNGFGNRNADVARSLPYTTGSMLAAAEYAILHRENVCSPTSGFHHAGYYMSGGYCTFNGLMVAAVQVINAGLARKVAIIDCDAHYGNGTQHILDTLNLPQIRHFTAGRIFRTKDDAANGRYLDWLHSACRMSKDADLVLYQAGADPHLNDPLGGILSGQTMLERDQIVHECFRGKPLVWNLAGGYWTTPKGSLSPTLQLHRATAREFAS